MNLKEITTALDQLDLSKYELIKKEEIADIHSAGLLLKHKKSGARVVVLSNDDENKVFSIGFKTPPFNDTGLQHIMEHSTLCGSRKYPVKDPFVELCKGSLNTFLNAMTYPDKTVYPVASCNLADFKNITDVYMDAVFYPNIYQREQIFKQEGWHYELDSIDSPLKYNGVVFNEMKGVYSSPDDVLSRDTFVSLFPDTAYRFESGGEPSHIPELSYEDFLAYHKKWYHPANSYIYLYGDFDVQERLDYLDNEYLKNFDANDVQISTVSGDVEIHGDYDHLKFASTSGDVELEAKVRQCDFSSVSGDLDLRFTGALSLINGSTTSGDIDVELPDDTGMNNIDVHSRSGDISMRRSGRRGSRTVTGSIRSVSGDIEIH